MEAVKLPTTNNSLKILILHQGVKVVTNTFCIVIKELFSSDHSNTLENFNTESSSCYCPNYIDCISLTFDKITPSIQYMSSFIYVDIILLATD